MFVTASTIRTPSTASPDAPAVLLALTALDPTIGLAGAPAAPAPAPAAASPTQPIITRPPSIANPSIGSIGAFIASVLSALFNRRK